MLLPHVADAVNDERHSLRSWLVSVPESDILRVTGETEIDYNPTALVVELEKRGRAPVVVIENPRGFAGPVVTNLYGSRARIASMVGAPKGDFNAAWNIAQGRLTPAVVVDGGPVHDCLYIGDDADATRLPISRHFEKDAGRYIGSGILVSKNPDTGARNLSYQRLQLKGPRRFGVSLHSRGHIWDNLRRAEELNHNLEVAVVIGVHPAIGLAAAAKVAKDVDEFSVAGGLLGEAIQLTRCRTVDIEVPVNAEYVIEGEILANIHEDEGPYGEYTGYSTDRSTRNVFVVKAITHRARPIYHDIIPGYSAEHLLLGRATREAHIFLRLQEMAPWVRALNYPKTGTHFHAYLSLRQAARGQARQAMTLLLGLDPYLKLVIAVDDDIDVFDEQDVLWALATRFQADADLFQIEKSFCNRLDPSSNDGVSTKLALDATTPPGWTATRAKPTTQAAAWARGLLGDA
jgi:2,5-furandicarboxylate decarboxylase 1